MSAGVPHKFSHLDIGQDSRIDATVELYGNKAELTIGQGVLIAGPCDINANGSSIVIGDGCDIASFSTISCADSHMRCIGLSTDIERLPIVLEDHVFVGQGATILGGCTIGHHSVIGAGVVLKGVTVPPYSLVSVAAPTITEGFYLKNKAQNA